MSEKTYQIVGMALGALVAILAIVGVVVDNWDSWWMVVAIAGVVTGLWWAGASVLVKKDTDPAISEV